MKWLSFLAILIPTAAHADTKDASDIIDGVEYRLELGWHPRSGWTNGLKASEAIREQCRRRLNAGNIHPSVCMVRRSSGNI
jgi:hypothetical protein